MQLKKYIYFIITLQKIFLNKCVKKYNDNIKGKNEIF